MKKNILILLLFSLTILAQENDKYIMLKPLTWDELQLYQLNSIKTAKELKLADYCPSTLKKLQSSYKNIGTHVQYIHSTQYIWSEFTNDDGNKCLVKHSKIDSISTKGNKTINPNEYELLNSTQARILKSASTGYGLKEKGYYKKIRLANIHNQEIQNKPYEKYGGMDNLVKFMLKHKPSYQLDKDYLKSLTRIENNTVISKKIPLYQLFEMKYSIEQQQKLLESVKKKVKNNDKVNSLTVKSTIQRVPNSQIIDGNFNPVPPYGAVGRNLNFFNSVPGGAALGSDVLFTPFITLTAAHILKINNESSINSLSYPGAVPNGAGDYNSYNGIFESVDSRYSNSYLEDYYKSDYGVLRSATPFIFPFTIDINIDNTYPRTVNVLGYPRDLTGLHKGVASAQYDPSFACTFNNGVNNETIHYPMNTMIGMSGGPIFDSTNSYTTGIHNFHCTIDGDIYGNGIPFSGVVLEEILSWTWNPTGTIEIQYPEPNIDINLVAIESFDASFSTFNKMDIQGNIEYRGNDFDNSIEWESNQNGIIGQGGIISADILKSTLSAGNHRITAKIDSNGESGEKNININIIRPTGSFTSPDSCIVDIANSANNTCNLNLSWTVTDTPETSLVWNATTNSLFATGNSGSQSFTANTSNTKFELYPSDQRKILLDTANVSAKLPTGNLTNNSSVCSLQPTPIDPNTGELRDPKATPPGCGTQLSWTNVQWASPSIFYRLVGSNTWQHLYQIPCELNGEICSGTINSDEISPELIPVNGAEFKLLQFNDVNSGLLSDSFTITAHRFADAYEFDDGGFAGLPVNLPDNYLFDNTLTTNAEIGVVQHGHSFHSPAVYDSNEDIDTIQIPVNWGPTITTGFDEGTVLSVTVSNMKNGLDVDINLECAGKGFYVSGIPGESIDNFYEGISNFSNDPTASTIIDPVTGDKTMEFVVTKETITSYEGHTFTLRCHYNRIVITRLSGTPSENLTYSVVVNETTTTPGAVTWTNKVNVNTTETSIAKTGTLNSWNSGAISTQTISGDGNLEFQKDLGTHSMIGLSNGDSSQSYRDIDFAIYMSSNNYLYVYESGVWKISSGSFTASDVFRIQAVDSTVQYLKNGAVFYISAKSPVFPLNIDTSLYSPGASYDNISLGSDITLPPTVEIDQYDDVPAQRAYDDDNPGDSVVFNGGTIQTHNFHDAGDEDWIIFSMGNGSGIDINTTQLGTSSAHLTAYRVDGAYTEISTGRWDITRSDLTQIDSDLTTGDNSVTVQNTTGSIQAYVIKATSSGSFGLDTDYQIQSSVNNPVIADQYDNIPAQRIYDDDVKERSVSWTGGTTEQIHNFHDQGDTDWTIVYMQGTRTFRTELIGSNADTKISVYKWISAEVDPNLSGAYINVVDQYIGADTSSGGSSFTVNTTAATVYAVKVESRNGAYGKNTDYKLIIETPPNATPQAAFTYSCNYLTCSFNASSSTDSDGTIASYAWSIGASGVTTSKIFSQAGTFPVTLTVTDNNGASNSKTKYVSVFAPITPDQYDNVPSQRAYNDDVRERSVSWGGGDSYHLHNFHDAGDSDWTIVYMTGTRTISTQLIGSRATTNLYVYKWISGEANSDGTFFNLVDEFVGSDTSGNSNFTINASTGTVFAVRVKSRYGYYGSGTEYKLIIQ